LSARFEALTAPAAEPASSPAELPSSETTA
jgi:hypothetical protein